MKKGGGRAKGHGFERKVSALLLEAAQLEKKHCYRTPMSGGHKHAGQGDLQTTKRMRKLFPFLVECKFYKTIPLLQILDGGPTEQVAAWIRQARRSERKELKIRGLRAPWMVVMKANNGPIISVGDERMLAYMDIGPHPYTGQLLRFFFEDTVLFMVPFTRILRALKRHRKANV